MTLTWNRLLLLMAVVVGPALAQYHAMGDCPALTSIQPFNPGEFLGTWHINKQYRVRVEEGMTCKTLDFGKDGSVNLGFNAKLKPFSVTGKFLVDASAAGIMKAKFDYSDVLGSDDVGEVLWYVADTDYTSYAIIAACQQLALTNKQYVYVLSRDLEPNAYDGARMEVAFRNTHFDGGGILETEVTDYCGTPKFQPVSDNLGALPPRSASPGVINSAHIPHELLNELDSEENLDRTTVPPPKKVSAVIASTTEDDGIYKPSVIHINIADSTISLNSDHPAIASIFPNGVSTQRPVVNTLPMMPESQTTVSMLPPRRVVPTTVAESTQRPEVNTLPMMPASQTTVSMLPPRRVVPTTVAAPESEEAPVPQTTDKIATNLYEEIVLNHIENEKDYEVPKVDGVDARVAAFIARLRNRPNFIEWSEIVDSPSFRRGNTNTNSPVDLFVNSLKNRPNFLDFAVNQEDNLYRNRIRGALRPRRT